MNTLQKTPIKERGRKVVEHPATSKASVPEKEVTHMPFEHEYGDSCRKFKIEHLRTGGIK